jgi:hypothetical protein
MDILPIIRRYFEAWNQHDPTAIVALFTERGVYRDSAVASGLVAKAIGDYAGSLFTAFPDLQFEIINAAPYRRENRSHPMDDARNS